MIRTVFGRNKIKKIKILDLPFQNNFTDFGDIGLTMIAGGTQPTFALSGRKAGEYCAVFNGSQSIKTSTNLPINSDKVTIAFWIKTTQTGASVVAEMSTNTNNSTTNAFNTTINEAASKIRLYDAKNAQFNIGNSTVNINDGTWKHIVLIINRSQGVNQNNIYVNGTVSYSQIGAPYNTDNNGNFIKDILFIGQRSGNHLGFLGSLTKLKIYDYPFTATDVTNLYNSEL